MVVNLKITSLNIRRGFRNKTDDILANYGDSDLICLQECCHMDTNLVEYLEKNNNYKLYISQGDTNTKGVVIIVNKNIENVNCHIIPQFLNGRLNHISIKLDKCVLHVLNIYGPAQQDERVNFYNHLNEYCRSINNNTDKYMVLGDFNCIISDLDTKSGNMVTSNNLKLILENIIDTLNVVDTFRYKYPNRKSYTFTNNRGQGSRIDKIYIPTLWCDKIKQTTHIPFEKSDHKAVVLVLKFQREKWGNSYWKFNESLLENENYIKLIENFWKGWKSEKLKYSLFDWWEIGKKKIKSLSITFSKNLAEDERKKLQTLYLELESEEDGVDVDENKVKDAKKKIIMLENKKKKGILIRSRQEFFEEDIDNIEIFKLAEEKRGDRREITAVLDNMGQIRENKQEVIDVVYNFYADLYKGQNIGLDEIKEYLTHLDLKKLDEEDWTYFDNFLSTDECIKIINSFEDNKSPGIDGLGKSFYSRFWLIIGKDLVEVLNNIYLQGELTDTMKSSIITMMYKNKGDYKDLKQWRPISLLCFDYKIIAKFLTNSLAKVINKLIDPSQTGAGPDKVIFDNLFSISSILEYMDVNELDGLLISFDQEKAFDRVEHLFITEVLKAMNLPVNFITWVGILYKNINSKVQVNGLLTNIVPITRSIRQGCPLSMSLYALIIETLASSIRCNDNIRGIHIPNTHKNTKLFQHADDCSIISTDISEYDDLIKEFKNFGQVSGSRINEQKTEILKIGNPDTLNHPHIHQLVKDKVKVLGIWFGKDHINTNWLQIQNKVKIQFEKWKDRRLSLRHKVLIINTYILSKILYVARIVPPSAKHIQIINRYIYTIFWGGNFEYLQRKSLIQPFCNGGQQVPDIQTKINALLLNRITQVLKGNNSAWTSIFSYFLGYTTRDILPELALNYVQHTIQTIGTHNTIKTLYLKYKENIILDNKTVKDIYLQLLELDKLTHKVELNYSYIDFKSIWATLCLVNTLYIREFIYKTIHMCLPTGKKMKTRGIYLDTYNCPYCKIL
jgi:exonuclease III